MARVSQPQVLTPGFYLGLCEIWQFRTLLRSLVVRDLRIKYQRSVLGFIWSLLNPLLILLILILVFNYVIRIQINHYWAFLLSGYFVWNFIQQTLNKATYILKEHASLRRSIAFPSEILILSASISKLVEFLIEILLVLVVLLLFHHHTIPVSLALFPLLVLIQLTIAVGLMYAISIFSVLFHDIQHALPIVIMGFFYISPVFYPVEMVPETVRPYFFLNPFAGILTLYQVVFYEGQFPSLALLGSVLATALVVFLAGYVIFNRYKNLCVEFA